jgi:hypothetical protein
MAVKIETAKFKPTQRKPQPITGELDFADKNLDPGILDIEIERLAELQKSGVLNTEEKNKLRFLLQQSQERDIENLQKQFAQGLLDETGKQELKQLLQTSKQSTSPKFSQESGQELNAYGMPSSSAQKKVQDAKYKQLLSKIGPIADSPIDISEQGVITPRIRLAQNIYGAENIQVIDGKPQFIVTEEMRQQSGLRLPDTMPLPAGLGAETLQRLGTSLGTGVLASGAAIPLAGLATVAGGPLAGAATMGAIEAAGGAGGEFFNVSRAVNELEKTGLLSPQEISELKAKEIPTQATYGGLAGLGGAALAGLPGAIKGVGQYLERAGTRGAEETAIKKAIQDAFLTEQLKQRAAADPYKGAAIMKNAVEKNVENYRTTADTYFSKAREASQRLRESGRSSGKDFADITDWWNEFTQAFKGDGKVVQEVADALGIVQTTPGRAGSTQVYSQATRDPITGEFLTSSLDFPATANARQIIDLGIPFQGPEIPGTGFTESLIQGAPTELPTSSVRVPGAKKTTTIKPSNKDIITGEVQGTITPDKYLDGYEAISRLADEAQMTNPRLYNKLVEAKVAYQKPLIKTNAQNQLLAAEDVAEFAGKQTKAGFTTFKSTPKIPEGTAGVPFTQVKLGFQTLEDGYTTLPVKVRTKFSGTPQEVNDKVFNQNGSLKLKTADAKQVNQAVINNYGEAAEARLKDIADSSIDQAVFRAKPKAVSEGYIGSKVTPELFEKARAVTPQQQKALQAKGVSLDLGEQAKAAQAGAGELTSKLDIGETGILNQSSRDQEAISALVGPQNYAQSQKPVMELFTQQQTPVEPTTKINQIKSFFQESGRPTLGSDIGLGTVAGGLIGAGTSTILPGINPVIGAGLGGTAGGLIGANVRPLARAASAGISQMPLEAAESFATNPFVRQGLVGAGKYAATNPNDISEAGSGIMQQGDDILQQILKLRKFTNGNY